MSLLSFLKTIGFKVVFDSEELYPILDRECINFQAIVPPLELIVELQIYFVVEPTGAKLQDDVS